MLTPDQINGFIRNGYVKIDRAFPSALADECRAILWKATGCNPHDPLTWTQPVIRIGQIVLEPFQQAANTEILQEAYDQLAGKDNWVPLVGMGTFPIRFPGKEPAGDTGWHVDAGFPGADAGNYFDWRINVQSRGRALLMLFLFSDVSEADAPTRIRSGSHRDVAKLLGPEGERGLSFMELSSRLDTLPHRDEVVATGQAGTVYLCHPFLVHAAQGHHGTMPRFMAQPALLARRDFNLQQPEQNFCPVELAIMKGMRE